MPEDPGGDIAVIDADEFTVTAVAVTVPNITVAPDTKPVPVIATELPPIVGPKLGFIAVTAGGA
jgi:hypothetical protein